MPLFLHQHILPETELGIWEIEENEQWFLDQLFLYPKEVEQLSVIKGQKRVEWLAVRHLVHQMSGRKKRGAFLKDEYGKPFLQDSSYFVSISHSAGMAAAIASRTINGIDIQKVVPKMEIIAPKFMRKEELASLQEEKKLEQIHVYWGAKECLYKAYGRRQLDFRQHIWIQAFIFDARGGVCKGMVKKEEVEMNFSISYRLEKGGYMLVYALEEG